jgi:aspartyl/asparaginyl-tRNA synthetase
MSESIDPQEFTVVANKMREFFLAKGWIEVHTQSKLSILAACEDPATVSTFNYSGQVWPLPQTGQMWLEDTLLNNPYIEGCFCLSTSYRQEANPIPGRHDLIFPMVEFETKGGMEVLAGLERELLLHLGFHSTFNNIFYTVAMSKYDVKELDVVHEEYLQRDLGNVVFLSHFPLHTSPFWNMRRADDGWTSHKIDVIIHGIETIGSAERSTDVPEMRHQFHTISDGKYAELMYSHFGRERVEKELEEFLSHDFFPRCGGGIGMTRMIRGMKLEGIL